MTVVVEVAAEATDELIEALGRLIPQLSAAPAPDRAWVDALVGTPGTHLLVARLDGRIVGTLTLATFPTPTRLRATVEDVVVDDAARGQGAGRALLAEAARLARAAGAPWIDLTSRAQRVAANRLYRSFGFEPRETNVYRMAL